MCNESLICMSHVKEQIPYIAHFEKNWAMKAIAQQFIKNKCNNSHKNQWTKPPEKYSHLQANSTKCSANGSCKKNGPMYRAPIAMVGGNECRREWIWAGQRWDYPVGFHWCGEFRQGGWGEWEWGWLNVEQQIRLGVLLSSAVISHQHSSATMPHTCHMTSTSMLKEYCNHLNSCLRTL